MRVERLLLAAVLLVAGVVSLGASRGAAATACSAAAGPAGGAYTASVCVTEPADGATLTGAVAVGATVTVTGTNPGIQRVVFYVDGRYALTDYAAPYTFSLRSQRFGDGAHVLEAEALFRDGFTSSRGGVGTTFANGVTTPPGPSGSFTPTAGTTPPSGRPFVLAAVGDGAGGEQSENDVVSLIKSWSPNLFLYLGDVYEKGSPAEFDNWYGPAGFFGDLRSITDPTIGNHEYLSSDTALGYLDYWNNVPHYFSVDAGGWHIVSLDTNAQFGGLAVGSPQYTWLANDLDPVAKPCTLVYYHHPRWNIGQEGESSSLDPLWALMAQKGVDVVVNGHDHSYQRWVPLDGTGAAAAGGITEFVAGTGGHAVGSFVRSSSLVAASALELGALRLALGPRGASWEFQSSAGVVRDSGALQCSGTPPDTAPPSVPAALTAASPSFGEVDLSWGPSTDDVAVAGYDVYRNGAKLASVGSQTSYADRSVEPQTAYAYTVRARDAAGNVSAGSNEATVTTQMRLAQFADDFETGDLSKWTSSTGVTPERTTVFGGLWAAQMASTGSPTFATKLLATAQSDLYVKVNLRVQSQGANVVNLLRLLGADGTRILTVYLNPLGRIGYRNDVTGGGKTSATPVAPGTWQKLDVHLAPNLIELWLDDRKLLDISGADSFGSAAVGQLELGDSIGGRTYDLVFDDLRLDVSAAVDTTPPSVPAGLAAAGAPGPVADLTWSASSDNVGTTGYDVYRGGALLASVGNVTAFTDRTVAPHTSYSYQVRARDRAGNTSALSSAVVLPVAEVARDGFESGALARWTANGLVAQQQVVHAGVWAARSTTTGAAASAQLPLSADRPELFYRVFFQVVSQGANPINLIRFRTSGAGASIATVFLSSTGKLGVRNDALGSSTTSTTSAAAGAWHELQLHAKVGGAAGHVDVWLDGALVAALSKDDNLGTAAIGRIELGETVAARSSDVVYDDLAVDTLKLPDSSAPTRPTGIAGTTASAAAIRLTWTASTDNVSVASYNVYRAGVKIGSVAAPATAFYDVTPEPGTTYTYTVEAVDGDANVGPMSAPATVKDAAVPLFADGFESGGLGQWTTTTGFTAQTQQVFAGTYAGRATSTGAEAFAQKSLPAAQPDVWCRTRVKILQLGSSANLLTLRSDAAAIVSLFATAGGEIGLRNEITGVSTNAPGPFAQNAWHQLVVHLVPGASGQVEVWVDGVRIDSLSKTDNLGTKPVFGVRAGDDSTGRTFDIAYDDVLVDTPFSDRTAPTAPVLTATAAPDPVVNLAWSASTDNVGVAGYDVLRDGTVVGTTAGTSYADRTVVGRTRYTYVVRARDGAGNSADSAAVSVTTPALFEDDFETGDLSKWTTAGGLAVQRFETHAGSFAARATSTTGTAASASKTLPSTATSLDYRLFVKVIGRGANAVTLMRFRTAAGAAIGTVSISSTGKLAFRDDASGTPTTTTSATSLPTGSWFELEAHLVVNGASSKVEIWLNRSPVADLTRPDALGSVPIGRVQLGETATGRTYDIAFDDVQVATG